VKNISWLNIWINLRLVLIIGAVIFLFSFTSDRNSKRRLQKSVVEFVGEDNQFVARQTVNNLLICNADSASALQKLNINLNKLEKTIESHRMISKSEVYVTIDGVLKTEVEQKTPMVRVFSPKGSFYIDYQGNTMPLSPLHSARILSVSGEFDSKKNQNLVDLFRLIYEDDFLKKNIIAIHFLSNGDLKMQSRSHNYELDFGKPINVEQKFNNYKAFFQKAVLDSTINNYKKITLRFNNQVVCTK
jgi:cell division protein FtsQ